MDTAPNPRRIHKFIVFFRWQTAKIRRQDMLVFLSNI